MLVIMGVGEPVLIEMSLRKIKTDCVIGQLITSVCWVRSKYYWALFGYSKISQW